MQDESSNQRKRGIHSPQPPPISKRRKCDSNHHGQRSNNYNPPRPFPIYLSDEEKTPTLSLPPHNISRNASMSRNTTLHPNQQDLHDRRNVQFGSRDNGEEEEEDAFNTPQLHPRPTRTTSTTSTNVFDFSTVLDNQGRTTNHEMNQHLGDKIQDMVETLTGLKRQVEEANKAKDAAVAELNQLDTQNHELKRKLAASMQGQKEARKEAEEAHEAFRKLKIQHTELQSANKKEFVKFAKFKNQVRVAQHEMEEAMKLVN